MEPDDRRDTDAADTVGATGVTTSDPTEPPTTQLGELMHELLSDEAAASAAVDTGADDRSELVRQRPDGVSDELVEAIGRASEALETMERARGHLYSFHQLMGRADLKFGEAADLLAECGFADDARRLDSEVVGRNAIDGRWSFQIVEEFDDLYHGPVRRHVAELEQRRLEGIRHLYESEMKERRRSAGRPGHEARPADPPQPEDG